MAGPSQDAGLFGQGFEINGCTPFAGHAEPSEYLGQAHAVVAFLTGAIAEEKDAKIGNLPQNDHIIFGMLSAAEALIELAALSLRRADEKRTRQIAGRRAATGS